MPRIDKLKKQIKRTPVPKNITWADLRWLLQQLGYEEDTTGGGSHVRFFHHGLDDVIDLHKPHPSNEVKPFYIKSVRAKLEELQLI